MAKALKEIESADFANVEKVITLMHMIKGQEFEHAQAAKQAEKPVKTGATE